MRFETIVLPRRVTRRIRFARIFYRANVDTLRGICETNLFERTPGDISWFLRSTLFDPASRRVGG